MGEMKQIKDALGNEIEYEKIGTDVVKERKEGKTKIDIVSFKALEWLISELESRVEDAWDNIVMITGQERSGKSTLGFHIYKKLAERLGKEYSVDNIYFSAKNLHKDAKSADHRDIFMLDEAGAELYGKEWYKQVQKSIVKLLQVIGKKELTIILNLPHRTLLNKDIRNRRIHYWFHTSTKKRRNANDVIKRSRGYAKLREPHTNEWSDTAFWKAKFTINYPALEDEVWEEYEKKKSEYIENMSVGDMSRYKMKYYTTLYTLCKFGELSPKTLADYVPYHWRTIYEVLEQAREDQSLIPNMKDELGQKKWKELEEKDKILKSIPRCEA